MAARITTIPNAMIQLFFAPCPYQPTRNPMASRTAYGPSESGRAMASGDTRPDYRSSGSLMWSVATTGWRVGTIPAGVPPTLAAVELVGASAAHERVLASL